MAANQEKSYLLRFFQEPQSTCKRARSGTPGISYQKCNVYSSQKSPAFTGRQRQPHNQGTGMVTIGVWIGTSCKRAIGGRILLWDGNPLRIIYKEPISTSSPRMMLSISRQNKDTNISCKSRMKGRSFPRHMQIISCTVRKGLRRFLRSNECHWLPMYIVSDAHKPHPRMLVSMCSLMVLQKVRSKFHMQDAKTSKMYNRSSAPPPTFNSTRNEISQLSLIMNPSVITTTTGLVRQLGRLYGQIVDPNTNNPFNFSREIFSPASFWIGRKIQEVFFKSLVLKMTRNRSHFCS